MIFLTFNDQWGGVFRSQVIGVLQSMEEAGKPMRLVSFISLRNYFPQRKVIRNSEPSAIVLPMFPGLARWRQNRFLLKFILNLLGERDVWARGIHAWKLASLTAKGRVFYDGRGAVWAEAQEYNVFDNALLTSEIKALERETVIDASFRIAVSEELVKWWQAEFNYNGQQGVNHLVIPCIADEVETLTSEERNALRLQLGVKAEEVLLVYAGSVAGWQSFSNLKECLQTALRRDLGVKMLFLSKPDEEIETLTKEFGDRIIRVWKSANEVGKYLQLADWGLLIRDQSVTNRVSSPVKFAEYLSAGLKVAISPGIGDYSEFVSEYNCGSIVDTSSEIPDFPSISAEEKQHIRQIFKQRLWRKSAKVQSSYRKLTNVISNEQQWPGINNEIVEAE